MYRYICLQGKGFIAFQKVSVFFHIHELFTKNFSVFINDSVIYITNIVHAYQLFKCNLN